MGKIAKPLAQIIVVLGLATSQALAEVIALRCDNNTGITDRWIINSDGPTVTSITPNKTVAWMRRAGSRNADESCPFEASVNSTAIIFGWPCAGVDQFLVEIDRTSGNYEIHYDPGRHGICAPEQIGKGAF